jgi:predicted component of type VI protein secretion system
VSFLNRFLPDRPIDDTMASVVRNLEYLLNSRSGFGSLLCPYGLADYLAEQGSPATGRTLLKEIEQNILVFEPRLRVFKLAIIGRDSSLTWHIELRGSLLVPYWGVACTLLILFHPISGAVRIEVLSGP